LYTCFSEEEILLAFEQVAAVQWLTAKIDKALIGV
jgi:hypothetical protein